MAGILQDPIRAGAIALTLLATPTLTWAEEPSVLYDQPVLVVDPGMHTALILRADTDRQGRFAVTGSEDRTVRVWSLTPPQPELLRTVRIPSGPDNIGMIQAVAMSPDGELIAAGGLTGSAKERGHHTVYLFSREGGLVAGIDGLPDIVRHLTFSFDGRYLAAGLDGGIRVYARDQDWAEVGRDTDYGGRVYGLAFAPDGRLATTSLDGYVRLYDESFQRKYKQPTKEHQPFQLAFRPDGSQLAVGFVSNAVVALLDGRTLAPLKPPDVGGIDNGGLSEVAWSQDGKTLYAGGLFDAGDGRNPVVTWGNRGRGARRFLFGGATNTISSLKPLPDGELLVAALDPHLAILTPDGSARWTRESPNFDPRGQRHNFALSADGTLIDFGYEASGKTQLRFDLRQLKLMDLADDRLTAPPKQEGLAIENWVDGRPTLDGAPLSLSKFEISHSLAIHPDGNRFVLGSDWYLRVFDSKGALQWRRRAPGFVWAVNVTGNGRMAVAAYGDGTIRWHRMDDGRELLAFMPLPNKTDWVAWTPEGFYGATPGAHGVLQWHVNRGWDEFAEAYPVFQFRNLRRPEALPLVLQEMDTARALGLDDMAKARREIQLRTGAKLAPGARLHLVSVGVGDYGEHARKLRLEFADKDAQDVASALLNTQGGLYADVSPQVLVNEDAKGGNVFKALRAMRRNMEASASQDLAVFMFSGHGGIIDGSYYLLPYDVDTSVLEDIPDTAIAVSELKKHFAKLGQHGRVLVLLDACRSGALAGDDGAALAVDGGLLRTALAGTANVTVLTSSSSTQPSREDKEWENGAFTEVLLRALGKDADTDRNSLISMTELTNYMTEHLPRLTRDTGAQTPGIEMRFQSEIFASNL